MMREISIQPLQKRRTRWMWTKPVVLVCAIVFWVFPAGAQYQLKGDLNNDGVVDTADVGIFRRELEKPVPFAGLSGDPFGAANLAPLVFETQGNGGYVGMVPFTLANPGQEQSIEVNVHDLSVMVRGMLGADIDGDGLTGSQEAILKTSPFQAYSIHNGQNPDAYSDDDYDGVSAIDEFALGTDPNAPDSDGDGFTDGWERRFGFDPTDGGDLDPNADTDADGLTNLDERDYGTDPTVSDTDFDGMNDGDEILAGLDPLVPDSDGDGLLDGDVAEICPLDPYNDSDSDFVCYAEDNCPNVANLGQGDADGDGVGDDCDGTVGVDTDVDGLVDADPDELCPNWPSVSADATPCNCGDVDGNGVIDLVDRNLISQAVEPGDYDGSGSIDLADAVGLAQAQNCDVNGDLLCNAADRDYLDLFLAGGAAPLPGCADIARVHEQLLGRMGLGGNDAIRSRLRDLGVAAFVMEQLDPASIPDAAVDAAEVPYTTKGEAPFYATLDLDMIDLQVRFCNQRECADRRSDRGRPAYHLQETKVLRSVHTNRQLESILMDFWFNLLNVNGLESGVSYTYIQDYERKSIRPFVLGRYEDLLYSSAISLAMLNYLDLGVSIKTAGGADSTNENYARELMELHTLGLVDTYDQDDVKAASYILTGHVATLRDATYDLNGQIVPAKEVYSKYQPSSHFQDGDGKPKVITLGPEGAAPVTTWDFTDPSLTCGDPAGSNLLLPETHVRDVACVDDGPSCLGPNPTCNAAALACHDDQAPIAASEAQLFTCLLARHPSTARRISERLVHRFVTEETGPGSLGSLVVEDATNAWLNSDGDLHQVVASVLNHPESRSLTHFGEKMKRPHHFQASVFRALGDGAEGVSAMIGLYYGGSYRDNSFRKSMGKLNLLGETLFGTPPPIGLPETSEIWASASGVVFRANLVEEAVAGYFSEIGAAQYFGFDTDPPASDAEFVQRVLEQLMPGGLGQDSTNAILAFLATPEVQALSTDVQASQVASLVLTSPEFLRH